MATVGEAIGRLRRPEYTGENRCTPCTVVNLVVATLVALAVAWLVPSGAGPLLGAGVLAVSLGAIALRGYLVPGTPWFTATYFPDWLLARFEKGPAAAPAVGAEGLDVERTLLEWGVLEPCRDVEDFCLADDFRAAWRRRVDAFDDEAATRADLATTLGTDPERLAVDSFGEAFVARQDGRRVGQWESRAAFLADVAAGAVLAERVDAWADLEAPVRGSLMAGTRLFVDECPACGGPVTLDGDEKRSCCRTIDVVAATCADCGARVFEAEVPEGA